MTTGGCQCGAIRYEVSGDPVHSALCHCEDCRASSGAPMVGWTAFSSDSVNVIKGEVVTYESSEHGRRQFCGACGTGIFFTNAEMLPGVTDIQTITLDDVESFAPGVHIQTADRISWMEKAHELPQFERYPG